MYLPFLYKSCVRGIKSYNSERVRSVFFIIGEGNAIYSCSGGMGW